MWCARLVTQPGEGEVSRQYLVLKPKFLQSDMDFQSIRCALAVRSDVSLSRHLQLPADSLQGIKIWLVFVQRKDAKIPEHAEL